PTAKLTCLRLLSEIQKTELDFAKLREIVCQDVSLSYKLLRYVNSALFSFRAKIRAIDQALVMLGTQGIRYWVALAALPTLAKDKPGELVTHSLVRAGFCERLAEAAGLQVSAQAFLMGLTPAGQPRSVAGNRT